MSRIRDIANLFSGSTDAATDAEVAAAVSAHNSTTTTVHGITDTSALATSTSVTSAVSTHATAANGHTSRGNTASRPASPAVGDTYINTQTGFIEIYESTGWSQVGGIASTVTAVTATDSPSGRAYNNGAAAITFTPGTILGKTYVVTSSPGSYTASGAASPITITGLQSSTSYTYTIVASNNYGTASASSASSAVTATTVPAAPTIGAVVGGNASATVAYTAGATGGSAVTAYTATSSPGSFTGTGSSPITVSGLTNGTSYTFTVSATNANGTSAASAASSAVTPVADLVVDYLVVAGGGGGGWYAGGGGAGGLRSTVTATGGGGS